MWPHRRQPTRLPRPWDSPSKNTGVVAISLSNAWKWKVKVKSLSRVQLLATPWTAAYQAPLPMGFSRQEYWSGAPLPSPKGQCNPSLICIVYSVQYWLNSIRVSITVEQNYYLMLSVRKTYKLSNPSPPKVMPYRQPLVFESKKGVFHWGHNKKMPFSTAGSHAQGGNHGGDKVYTWRLQLKGDYRIKISNTTTNSRNQSGCDSCLQRKTFTKLIRGQSLHHQQF